MLAKVNGRWYFFCDGDCKADYEEDLAHGLIYGPYVWQFPDGTYSQPIYHWEYSLWNGACAYCNYETGDVPIQLDGTLETPPYLGEDDGVHSEIRGGQVDQHRPSNEQPVSED